MISSCSNSDAEHYWRLACSARRKGDGVARQTASEVDGQKPLISAGGMPTLPSIFLFTHSMGRLWELFLVHRLPVVLKSLYDSVDQVAHQ